MFNLIQFINLNLNAIQGIWIQFKLHPNYANPNLKLINQFNLSIISLSFIIWRKVMPKFWFKQNNKTINKKNMGKSKQKWQWCCVGKTTCEKRFF